MSGPNAEQPSAEPRQAPGGVVKPALGERFVRRPVIGRQVPALPVGPVQGPQRPPAMGPTPPGSALEDDPPGPVPPEDEAELYRALARPGPLPPEGAAFYRTLVLGPYGLTDTRDPATGMPWQEPATVTVAFFDGRAPRATTGPRLATAERFDRRGWVLRVVGVEGPLEHFLFDSVMEDVTDRTGVRSLAVLWEYLDPAGDQPVVDPDVSGAPDATDAAAAGGEAVGAADEAAPGGAVVQGQAGGPDGSVRRPGQARVAGRRPARNTAPGAGVQPALRVVPSQRR